LIFYEIYNSLSIITNNDNNKYNNNKFNNNMNYKAFKNNSNRENNTNI